MLAKVISYVDVQVAKLITVTPWQYRSTTPYCPVHCGITYKTAQQIFEIPPVWIVINLSVCLSRCIMWLWLSCHVHYLTTLFTTLLGTLLLHFYDAFWYTFYYTFTTLSTTLSFHIFGTHFTTLVGTLLLHFCGTLFTMLVVNVYQRAVVVKVWYKCSKGLPKNVDKVW